MPDNRSRSEPATGTAANGMEYARWRHGAGPGRSALLLPGGPGSAVPHGLWGTMFARQAAPYLDAGFDVWTVTRQRGMPTGHGIAGIADDHAAFVDELLGGRVDLVVGTSFGGMVALHLAARSPDTVGRLVLVASGAAISTWCADVDRRLAAALRRGDVREAATVFGEYAWPGPRMRWLRRAAAPVFGRVLLPDHPAARSDAVVELEAEAGCDARPVLPDIEAPVLVLAGEDDRIFPLDEVVSAARSIHECTVLSYPGKGHVGMASSSRAARDVLAHQPPASRAG